MPLAQALAEWEKKEAERLLALASVKGGMEENEKQDAGPQFIAYVPLPEQVRALASTIPMTVSCWVLTSKARYFLRGLLGQWLYTTLLFVLQAEIEQRVLEKKKADLLAKYTSSALLGKQQEARSLLNKR